MPRDARAERAELAPFGCNEKLMGCGAERHAKSMASPKRVGQVFDYLWWFVNRRRLGAEGRIADLTRHWLA